MPGPWEKYGSVAPNPLKVREQQLDNTNKGLSNARIPVQIEGDQLNNAQTRQKLRQGGGLGEQDQKFINEMRAQIGDIDGLIRNVRSAAPVIDRYNPSPTKAFATEIATPKEEGSGLLDQAGAWVFNSLVSDQDKRDYQTLKRFQNEQVLGKQIEQKGPQTESDALRMQMTSLSPGKYKGNNAQIIGDTLLKARLLQRKPGFFTEWASKNGSINARAKDGKTVDQAWQEYTDAASRRYQSNLKGAKAKGKPQGGGFKYLGIEER